MILFELSRLDRTVLCGFDTHLYLGHGDSGTFSTTEKGQYRFFNSKKFLNIYNPNSKIPWQDWRIVQNKQPQQRQQQQFIIIKLFLIKIAFKKFASFWRLGVNTKCRYC